MTVIVVVVDEFFFISDQNQTNDVVDWKTRAQIMFQQLVLISRRR